MKQMTGIWMAAVLGVMIPGALRAQQDELNRQVEVNKEYRPDVERADKLLVPPRMTDTVKLRPESEYSIRPSAWHRGFGVTPIAPARIDASIYRIPNQGYLKAGLGAPLQGLLDFYADRTTGGGRMGAYANLRAHKTDVDTDFGWTVNDKQFDGSFGLYGEVRGGYSSLGIDLGVDHRVVTRYAGGLWWRQTSGAITPISEYAPMQHFFVPRMRIWAGNDFSDMSRFNTRFEAEGYVLSDRYDAEELGGEVSLHMGKLFGGVHKMLLSIGFETYDASALERHFLFYELYREHSYNHFVRTGARYGIEKERFKMEIGGDYAYDSRMENHWFFPAFRIKFDVTSGYFVPFIEVDGRLNDYGYRNTSLWNPYVMPGLTMDNTAEYNGRGGISGSFSSAFSYRVYAGMSVYKNMNIFLGNNPWMLYPVSSWTGYPDGEILKIAGQFGYLSDNATMFTVGGEVQARISGAFEAELAAQYFAYHMKHYERAGDRPNFDASFGLRYQYKEKFSARAGVRVLGRRYSYQVNNPADPFDVSGDLYLNKISPVADITLDLEYRINPAVTVFLSGRNLGNSKLYVFNHYPSMGINALAGVVLSF